MIVFTMGKMCRLQLADKLKNRSRNKEKPYFIHRTFYSLVMYSRSYAASSSGLYISYVFIKFNITKQ